MDELYPDIAEKVWKRKKEIEGTREPLGLREEVSGETSAEISKEGPSPDTKSEMADWKGAWLLIFIFFLAITLAVTGLSLLFGGPSPFGAYWFFWGILVLLVIIYPVALFINRRIGRR